MFLDDEEPTIPRYAIAESELDAEWDRFVVAVGKAKDDVGALRDRAVREMGQEHGAIFDSHLVMLEDPDLLESIEETGDFTDAQADALRACIEAYKLARKA